MSQQRLPIALLITAVAPRIEARIVEVLPKWSFAYDSDEDADFPMAIIHPTLIGLNRPKDYPVRDDALPPVTGLQVGHLIVAQDGSGMHSTQPEERRVLIGLTDFQILGQVASLEDAEETLLTTFGYERRYGLFRLPCELRHEAERDRESGNQDRALVLAYPGPHGYTGSVLGYTGVQFLELSNAYGTDAYEMGLEVPKETGVFVLENARYWSTGDGVWEDFDWGIDTTRRRATPDDVQAFGITHLASDFLDLLGDYDPEDPMDTAIYNAIVAAAKELAGHDPEIAALQLRPQVETAV